MKRGSPGGLYQIIVGATLSLCCHGTSSAEGAMNVCATPGSIPALSLSSGATGACAVADSSAVTSGFELKADASDNGAYWFQGDDPHGAAHLALTADPEINRAITFRAATLATPLGELEFHGGVGKVETSDALTFDRLRWADGYSEDSTTVGAGAIERLFNGRLVVSTDLSWSTATSLWRDASAPAALDVLSRNGMARWHRLEAKLLDDPDFKWSITGEMSHVDEGYTANSATRPGAALALRGETTKWATQVSAWGATALASTERFAGLIFDRNVTRLKLDVDGISATLYAKDLQRQSLIDPTQWISRKAVNGATLEIIPQVAAPAFAGQSPLVPELISLSWEAGSVAYPGGTTGTDQVTSWEALATWKTVLGETTALYTNERQGHDIAGLGYAGDASQIIDVSQSFKYGDWRFSAGASLTILGNSSPDGAFADNGLSGKFAIRYAPQNGPSLEASLGRTHDEFALDDFDQRSRATTLSLSLDVSDYVQRQLDRRDTTLKFDFRHELNQDQSTGSLLFLPEESTRNTDAALLTFGTPL